MKPELEAIGLVQVCAARPRRGESAVDAAGDCRRAVESRAGATLLMAMLIVLLVGMLGVGLLRLGEHNAVEVSQSLTAEQAFWAAEAGRQDARFHLLKIGSFRTTPVPLGPVTLSNGVYRVTTIGPDANWNYSIRSTGVVASSVRAVWQQVYCEEGVPPAFGYGLFGGSGTMWLKKDGVFIDGSLYQNGDVTISTSPNPPTFSNSEVIATGTIGNSNSLPVGVVPDPPPEFPLLDTSGYDALIATAGSIGTNSIAFPFNLGGKTNYVANAGTVTINNNITGSGMLVFSGNVGIDGNPAIGSDVKIVIGGMLTLGSGYNVGSNNLIYASAGVDMAKNCTVTGYGMLITAGDFTANMNLNFQGLIFVNGWLDVRKDVTITGSVLAKGGMEFDKNLTVNYTNLMTAPLPMGFTPVVVMTNVVWMQVL